MKKTKKLENKEIERSSNKMSTLLINTIPHGKGTYQNSIWYDNILGVGNQLVRDYLHKYYNIYGKK